MNMMFFQRFCGILELLWDNGASTSLLVEGVLPLSDQSATGDYVLLHGVELGFVRVPLQKVFLQSDLVSGSVIVGMCPTLPVEGVNLLLGNDLAGDKVMANPCVSSFLVTLRTLKSLCKIFLVYFLCMQSYVQWQKDLTI